MLTSIFDDNNDSNEPSDSYKKNNQNNNFNNKNNKNNNNTKYQRKFYEEQNMYNEMHMNEIINNENKKNQKDNYKINLNVGNNDYYNHNFDNNSKSPHSINKKYNIKNENINKSPYNSNLQEDKKISPNRPKKSVINISNTNNSSISNNYDYLNSEQKSINTVQKRRNNNNINDFPENNYEIKDYKLDNLKKNEYYIKYVTLNRKGYEFIHDRNYISALSIFQNCYELSKNYLNDRIKEINSLINISICEYYNGNFSESYTVISKAKIIYDSISLDGYNISPKQILNLTLKLFINSSLSNLSINNYNECKNDIKFLISTIKKESDYEKQYSYYKNIIFTLFKVESLNNYDDENNSFNNIENSYNDVEINEPIKIINHLMKGFLNFLNKKNFDILLNTFKEAAQKYKRLNDFNGYYFSLFYHYLVLFNQKKNNDKLNELEDIKKKISICNNNLIGNEFINQIKEKDINKLLKEFTDKIKCACEIYHLLENFENELNIKLNENNKEKDLSEDESNLSYSHLLDKSHIFTNEKINSPIFVKLLLRYSINFLENQKKINNTENSSNENYDTLINEINLMMKKISSNEINIENIKLHQLDKEMINSLKQLFDNLIFIYYKSKLYKYFKKYHNKVLKKKNTENIYKIVDFLNSNSEELTKGLNLIKINYKTKGYKSHFYNIDEKNLTFNIRKSINDNYPNKSYSLEKDIIKVIYGIKSRNLRKKLLTKDKDVETIKLLRMPWRFLSIITKSRSIDLYSDNNEINTLFYGLKSFFIDNKMAYKINSTNYFLLNKIKLKLVLRLQKKYKDENKENLPNIVKQLVKEKAIQNISFTKLFLIYNKFK